MATTTSTASTERVVLRGGLTVSVDALRLLWDLEERGFYMRLDGAIPCIRPSAKLTPSDREALHAHRDEVRALLAYCDNLSTT